MPAKCLGLFAGKAVVGEADVIEPVQVAAGFGDIVGFESGVLLVGQVEELVEGASSSTCNPAASRAPRTSSAASAAAPSTSVKRSTSSVGRWTKPLITQATPPPRTKPCRSATVRAIRATSR